MVFIAAQKIDGMFKGKEYLRRHTYPFDVLFDETREVSRRYGVHQTIGLDAYNIARRSIFIVGRGGRLCWIAVSPTQFEAPDLRAILDAIEACDKY